VPCLSIPQCEEIYTQITPDLRVVFGLSMPDKPTTIRELKLIQGDHCTLCTYIQIT